MLLWLPYSFSVLSIWKFSALLGLALVCVVVDLVVVHDIVELQAVVRSVAPLRNARAVAEFACAVVINLSPWSLVVVLYCAFAAFVTTTYVAVALALGAALALYEPHEISTHRRQFLCSTFVLIVFDCTPSAPLSASVR